MFTQKKKKKKIIYRIDEAPPPVPELDRPMTSTSKFFIVYGTFAIVAVLGLWG